MVQHHPSKRLKLHHEVIGGARLDSSGIKPCCFATRHPKKGEKKYWNIIEPWCPTLHLSRNPLKAGTGHQRSMKITLGIAREVCFRGYSSYMFLEGDGGKMAKWPKTSTNSIPARQTSSNAIISPRNVWTKTAFKPLNHSHPKTQKPSTTTCHDGHPWRYDVSVQAAFQAFDDVLQGADGMTYDLSFWKRCPISWAKIRK